MATSLLNCPICSQPGFSSLDSLRLGLISAATRQLVCPVCQDILLGLDKFTIHLFSHSLQHSHPAETCQEDKICDNILQGPKTFHSKHDFKTSRQNLDGNREVKEVCCKVINEKMCKKNLPINISHQNNEICLSEAHKKVTEKLQIKEWNQHDTDIHFLTLNKKTKNPALFLYHHADMPSEAHKNVSENQQRNKCHQNNTESHFLTLNQNVNKSSYLSFQHTDVPQNLSTKTGEINMCEGPGDIKRGKQYLVENLSLESQSSKSPDKSDHVTEDSKTDKKNHSSLENLVVINHENVNEAVKKVSTNISNTAEVKHVDYPNNDKTEVAKCDLCGFSFRDSSILQMHQQLVHTSGPEVLQDGTVSKLKSAGEERRQFPCHLCQKAFKMRGSLMVHLRVGHGVISAGKSLTNHTELEPQNEQRCFICNVCNKSFKKEQHLSQHNKTHEGKQWECQVCCKLFTTKYFLKKHKRLHTGEMPYSCPMCSKTFTFQQSYHKHLLYHSDEKPHVCSECDRAFKELSTLHNHQRIHTGEKPFACETCGRMPRADVFAVSLFIELTLSCAVS